MEGAGPSTGKAATVWVQAGAEWLVGDVTSVDGQTAQVKTPDGRIHKLSTSSLLYTNSEGSDGIADLVKLEHLHEASIWHSLKSRYDKNVIYTYIGPILVSINPYTDLKLYTQSMVDHYRGKFISETQPHIYALADQTFRNMMNERKNQSVLISGESGAGKTEATKIMLAYLAKICSSNIVDRVAQQVLESNPVLEAFGNAKTVRNNNSSRFGKYFEVLFDAAGRIVGANIENYLLEKSRVVSQAENERSYHIFYQLCAGASAEEKAALHLGGVDDYAYLQNGSSHKIEGVDDAADFQHVKAAMTLIGFDVREQRAMFRIVSAILHLGNITFDEREDGEASAISEDGRKQLEVVCELLEVDLPTLEEGLCSRTMSGGQGDAGTRKPSSRPSLDPRAVAAKEKEKSGVFSMRIPLKPAQAAANRDALAKGLYGRMFSWLVQRVNESIRAKSYANSIGILDIYGFEVFTRNSFEQLCINYTNEKLHQQYLENLFKLEQEEYKREGINWELVKFTDNADVIELIESRAKVSILSLLDDESQFPRGADETLLHKLHENLSRQKCYVKPRRDADKSFVVTHYAGDVTYEAEGFVDKNKDTVHIDLVRAMQTSKCDIVSLLFAAGQQNFAAGTAAPVKKPGSAVSLLAATTQPTARTVSAYFRDQLASLMERLRSTEIHYVRCIKPNHDQAPHYIDTTLIMNQLRYTGILDTIRIRRQGFAIRRSHKDFILRYRVLWSRPEAPPADPKAFCLGILESAGVLPDGDWALGSTRVYIRDDKTMSALESLLEKRLAASALKVQATVRGRLTRRRFVALRSCARALQFLVRLKIARDRFRKRYRAALRLQCAWRTRRLERRFQKLREAAFIIQTAVRKWRARRRAAEIGPSGNQVEKGTTALARKLRLILGEVKKRHHIAAGTAGSALNAMVDRHVRQPMPRRQCKAQTAADIDRVRLALERALGAAEPAIEAACVDAVRREIEYLAEVTRGAGAAGLSASPFFDKAGPSSSGTEEEKENRPPPLGLGKQLFEQSATLQEEKRMLEKRVAELERLKSAAELAAKESAHRLEAFYSQVLETTKAEHAAKMTESVKEKRELQERYDAARREADTLLSDKRALSDTLEQRMGEVEKLRARVEEAARALEESQAAGRKAQDDIRSLEREREGLKSEIARATAALREQEAATRAVEEEKGASASAARALDDAKARVEARLAESEAARATAEAELESVQRELAAVKKERHGLSNQVAQLEELQAAESAAAKDARGRLAELQKEKAALENQFAVAKGERAGLERELEQLREAKKGDISKLKEAAEAENLRLVRERAELQTRLEVELAESQRQVSTLGEMKAALERDLNDVRERRRVIGDQLRDTEAAKEAAEAALAAAQARGRKLEADLAEARDKLAQADEARRALEGELERARAAGEKLAKEKAALEAAAAELERGKERAERERAAAEEEASKLQREASHTQKHLRDLEQSKTVLEGDVARLTGRCQALETERAELAERLTRADRARNEAASELDSAVDKRKELEREKRRLKEELHEAEDREEAARREAAAQQARAEQAEASGARLAEKLAAEERKCASVGAEAEDRARRLEALAQERDELRGRLGAEEEACRQALAGVARLERELARATGDYEEAEGRAREREARVAELEEQLAEEHEAVAAATSENGQLQERLREQELLAQDRGAAVEKLKAELEGAQREAAAAAGELEAARRELAGAQAELLAVQTEGVEEVERLQCENADISEELDQANLALTKLEKKHEALEKEMRRREDAWASEKETTKETIQSLMDKLQEARMETAGVRESERELERARAEIRALKDRIAVLEEANREVAFNAIG